MSTDFIIQVYDRVYLSGRSRIDEPRLGAVARRPPPEVQLGAISVTLREVFRRGQLVRDVDAHAVPLHLGE